MFFFNPDFVLAPLIDETGPELRRSKRIRESGAAETKQSETLETAEANNTAPASAQDDVRMVQVVQEGLDNVEMPDTTMDVSMDSIVSPPVKRQRGRPRKYPLKYVFWCRLWHVLML